MVLYKSLRLFSLVSLRAKIFFTRRRNEAKVPRSRFKMLKSEQDVQVSDTRKPTREPQTVKQLSW